jgi:Zn-dependent M28 family amino/carboxypeptidase
MARIKNSRVLFPVLGICSMAFMVSLTACNKNEPSAEPEPTPTPRSSEAALAAAAVIDEEGLRSVVSYLASDELEGRGPASEADELTQNFLAKSLQELGMEPGGPDGQWTQPFDIVGITSHVPETMNFSGSAGSKQLKFWDDFIAASGVQSESAEIPESEVVFVGYGIEAPEYAWDDYKGADLNGKVLLMLNNDPDWDPDLFQGDRRLYYGRWTYKYESAARQGALGAIIIHTTPSAGYPFQVVQTSWTGEQFELPAEDEPRCLINSWVTEEAARELVQLAGMEYDSLLESARSKDFVPVELGITTSLSLKNDIGRVQTANVAGLLRGSDPSLGNEVVVYTAHHDHLGIGEPNDAGDTIYNGARDNASGVAQILGAAKAASQLATPPKRSMLFLFVAAEEQGLLGSKYYSLHPTFAPGKIAANVNLDSANIWGTTTDLTFIGLGKSSLDTVVQELAAEQDRTVFGDQFPDRGSFYRSDQFNFAKIGVPAIYLNHGTRFVGRPEGWGKEQKEAYEATNYHQPSDELDDTWNFDGMIQDAQLAFLAGLRIANEDALPTWVAGDEFEAARLAALEDVGE